MGCFWKKPYSVVVAVSINLSLVLFNVVVPRLFNEVVVVVAISTIVYFSLPKAETSQLMIITVSKILIPIRYRLTILDY